MSAGFEQLIFNTGLGKKDDRLLTFVTSVRYTAQIAKMINNMTFMFDPNWQYGEYEQNTLPISFYFIKKWEELGDTETNTKTAIFFNSSSAKGEQRNGAVTDIIADNIVNQPKVYRMDVLVPFAPDACLEQYQLDLDTTTNVYSSIFLSGSGDTALRNLSVTQRVVANSVLLLRTLIKALSVDLNASSIVNAILAQNDINKVSLDAMRDYRGILKMKMWNGWKFKYVNIKNISLHKSGEMEGFYEGSITVQEVPVLNVYQQSEIRGQSARRLNSGLQKLIGEAIKGAVNKAIGGMEAQG